MGAQMTIVVGYVPTPEGLAALDKAIALARKDAAELVVVNTGHYGNYNHPDFASGEELDAIADQLAAAGVRHVVEQPTSGRAAADEILRAADQHDAELIVIGLRRRSAVGKLITGSTAQSVLLEAACPVLAVKAPAGDPVEP